MKGQVRLRDILRVEKDGINCASPPIPPRKTPKNRFAKEVESVIEGLRKKEEEFKQEVVEKKRDQERREEQNALISNMRLLIDSQRATNEMMQNWIDVSLQQAASYQA